MTLVEYVKQNQGCTIEEARRFFCHAPHGYIWDEVETLNFRREYRRDIYNKRIKIHANRIYTPDYLRRVKGAKN
jgi:hypothetical protein